MQRSMRRKRVPPAALAACLLVLTLVVALGPDPLPGEAAFIRWIQGWTGWARDPAEFVRDTTGTTAAVLLLALISPVLVWLCGVRALAATAIGLLTVYGIQPALKDLIDRARPDATQVEVLAGWTSPAYPSGHAIGTTMIWGYLAWLALQLTGRRWLAALFLLPIPATVFSSLVQGVHWPTDLLGGTLIGALAAWCMARVAPRIHRARSLAYPVNDAG
jgi:membrane-associated phospholipid phosphatase